MTPLFLSPIIGGSVFVKRAIAFVIDIAFSCVITYILTVAGNLIFVKDISFFAFIIGVMLVIGRDAIGKSPGKSIMRLEIININTNKRASLFRRIARNITCPFWMIEVIVCCVYNGLRITDFWLGTKVVSNNEVLL